MVRSRRNTRASGNKQASGQIRIIGGQHRGRRLPVHDIEGLRPTTDRVKETLFNWLMMDIRDAHVLDCFAGAGSLGFEAASRFAQQVTFIELDKTAASQLKQNCDTLKLNSANVINDNALHYLAKEQSGSFDIAFVDPPFNKGLAMQACELLEQHNHLNESAFIYVEVEKELVFNAPQNWQLVKEKAAGQVMSRLYQRC